jgi:hypothetical protein
LEFFEMKTYCHVAVATALIACLQATPLRAQTAPSADAAAAPAATATAPATPPAATQPASASTDKAGTAEKTTASEASTPKPKKRISMSTRQQVEHALKTGTVPARYRSQVPKEYQRYIPFEK